MNHPARLWTIGHSTLAAAAFTKMLTAHRVELVADVRRFPASRRHPQFNLEALAEMLEAARPRPTAMMCAEKSWCSCHRGLIADHLKVSGIEVIYILDATATEHHPWTAATRLIDGRLTYAAPGNDQQKLF